MMLTNAAKYENSLIFSLKKITETNITTTGTKDKIVCATDTSRILVAYSENETPIVGPKMLPKNMGEKYFLFLTVSTNSLTTLVLKAPNA